VQPPREVGEKHGTVSPLDLHSRHSARHGLWGQNTGCTYDTIKVTLMEKLDLKKLTFKEYLKRSWKLVAVRWTIIPLLIVIYIVMNPWYITLIMSLCIVPFNLWIEYMAFVSAEIYYRDEQTKRFW
jgi:hypothetical protein